ncbi:CAP domain-containing protein [Aquamicrobium sp. LC103]|uniref:CAP domain-containing protein n=1 Tax=Aquamicrobium sp. LC103 TaxID=1120658 RepID=UPI00063EADF6|nr:CAP domain-containing protein [Aquamicrobium sp. LC103]TKT74990.1 CAP domain-containing protein [Aquamicrobium sp. LC103]
MQQSNAFAVLSRRAIHVAALVFLALLAACQTAGRPGDGAGASRAGVSYLADIRSQNGLPTMSPDATLERAALRQAGYMAQSGRMAHDTGWRKDFATRMAQGGVAAPAAENLAHGRMELDRVFQMWMNSQGHRRNMLDERFTRFGLAYVKESPDSDRRYWALVLGK